MNKRWIMILAALALAAAVSAQSLSPSPKTPSSDGVVKAGEYSFTGTYKNMTLHLSLSADGSTLYVALEAPTTGWVAVGLGSLRMDGAFMVMGYDAGGKAAVSEETGRGHGHSPNSVKKLASWAVRESAGSTVLEFSVPSRDFLSGATLKTLIAYGRRDDFSSFHAAYSPAEFPVAK